MEIFVIAGIVLGVTVKAIAAYKEKEGIKKSLSEFNKDISVNEGNCQTDVNLSKTVDSLGKQKENVGMPTKVEFFENIRKINQNELNSYRFKKTQEFVSLLRERENKELEKKLFRIVGTYELEDNLMNKNYEIKRKTRVERYNKLRNFMNSLTASQINSNPYLKATLKLINTSSIDCKGIIGRLENEIKEMEISNEDKKVKINVDIPNERINLIPMNIKDYIGIPDYRPYHYKNTYVNLLDRDNRYVYEEYNEYASKVTRLAEDIYYLQMWNLLSNYPEQIDNYYFSIVNNESEHQFKTAYFINKNRKNEMASVDHILEKYMEDTVDKKMTTIEENEQINKTYVFKK